LVKESWPDQVIKGSELFDAALFKNHKTMQLFFTFIGNLKKRVMNANATETHYFINELASGGKLLRCYTQNIDGLEKLVGLNLGTNVVQLHGDLDSVSCTCCSYTMGFDLETVELFATGKTKACTKCKEGNDKRVADGKRSLSVGILRPNIVLYNEFHKNGR
jgi:NAD-dependent histone deacetylase SIR2